MALGIVTPLHGVVPALAEAQQPHVLRKRSFDVLISSACSGVGRSNLQKFKWIIELIDSSYFEPLPADRLQCVLSPHEVIEAHLALVGNSQCFKEYRVANFR